MLHNRHADRNMRARTDTAQGRRRRDDDEAANMGHAAVRRWVKSERTTSLVKLAGD
jgi:hypothetical protein